MDKRKGEQAAHESPPMDHDDSPPGELDLSKLTYEQIMALSEDEIETHWQELLKQRGGYEPCWYPPNERIA